jgi:single-strand DNA-binding protein
MVTPHLLLAIQLESSFIMASFNKVILMGNLTRDPELKTLPSQTAVCDFSLAVNRRWKDANGADREDVLFIDCVAFGKTGETIAGNLAKGRPIHIEGRLRLEQWEQEDGQKRSKIRVVVEQFRFVDAKPTGNGPSAERNGAGRGKRRANGKNSRPARQAEAEPVGAGADKDIPF